MPMLEPISQHLERSRLSEEFLRVFPYDPGVEIKQKGAGGRDDGELIVDLPLDDIVIDVRFPENLRQLVGSPDAAGQHPDISGMFVDLEEARCSHSLYRQELETRAPETGFDGGRIRRRPSARRLILRTRRHRGKTKNPRQEDK